ncbi:MAG: AAA family ATPase [Deltaproteobacteria bacterium]|nr:AAA family ATPase [Deltaproteobacteria bacterium]
MSVFNKIPDPKELEKELNEYLAKKYGSKIKLAMPLVIPQKDEGVIEKESKSQRKSRKIRFDLKPEELEAYLNEFIVKQDDAKEVLATKICTHFNRIKYWEEHKGKEKYDRVGMIKSNIIMIGPTGVGKTYLIKLIAKRIGVPFVKGDATKFSETGYVGGDVEDLVRDLLQETNGDIELAQCGIIYIDEIDKIASGNNVVGIDVSRTGVQRGLLKPMEETEVDLKVPHDIVSQMEAMEHFRKTGKKEKRTVNTKNILFIVSGAFNALTEIIEKRVNRQSIGFGADLKQNDDETDYLKMVTSKDLMQYGFESEFIGRLPVLTVFSKLDVSDLYQILKNRNSEVINGKKWDFKAYGIDLRFEDKALYKLAERAFEQNTGARGLVSVVEKALMKFEKKLPSTTIKRLLVTKEIVDNPEREIELLLKGGEGKDEKARYNKVIREEKTELKEYIKKQKSNFPERFIPFLKGTRLHLIVERVVKTGIELGVVLEEILSMDETVRKYEKTFFKESGIKISFEERAVDQLLEMALEEETPIDELCNVIFKNYQQGLKLVKEKTGKNGFMITKEAIRNPEGFLNKLIKESYEN